VEGNTSQIKRREMGNSHNKACEITRKYGNQVPRRRNQGVDKTKICWMK